MEPKQDATPQAKTMNFKFKVTNKQTTSETALISSQATVAYQYQQGAAVENPALAKAVTTIETAHNNKSFKLKADKTTMSQVDVDKLTANPKLLLTTEFTDGFPKLDQGIIASITNTKANFQIVDKKQAQGTANKTIQFKVTVSDAQKVEKETKQLTFDFTLQANTAPAPAKQQTVAKQTVTAAELGLNGKVDVVEPTINEDWIVQNIAKLVDGDQNVTKTADVSDLVKTKNPQDSTLLTIAFKLAADTYYLADGTPGKNKSEAFTIQITGFQKAGQTLAVKKAEFNASELDPAFVSKNFEELNLEIHKAKWLFDNRERYLDGDITPGTLFSNFIFKPGGSTQPISFTQKQSDPGKATMRFSIAAGRTYNEKGVPTTTETLITFDVVLSQ